MYERLYDIFSEEDINKLHKANILLAGVGGVGSFCFEALIRSGIQNITIIDFDEYEESNLNRQLHSNRNNLGKKKVKVLKEYTHNINPDIKVNIIDEYLKEESNIDISGYDYIIDAVDSISAKCLLIKLACDNNKRIISSMGIAKRLDPSKLMVTTLAKTYGDPLAKKLRYEIKKRGISDKIKVVFSKEEPVKREKLGSYMIVTAYAGLLLADTVIKDIIHEWYREN